MKTSLKNATLKKYLHVIFISLAISLSGCFGGGGGGGIGAIASAITGGGIGGTGVSQGALTGFGSILLNGIEFDTSGATITINDAAAIESDLQVGQVVRAEVDFGALTASRVDYAETVRGPIQAIDLVNRTMTVLNQQVIVNDTTSFFNNLLFEDLVVTNEIEISGIRTSTGAIVASYIRLRNGTAQYRVIGEVANLGATTFEIVGPAPRLIVDFSAANQASLTGSIVNGRLIEAIGLTGNFNAGANTFTVSDVEDGLELNAVVGDDVEVEGIISVFTSATNFEVNGQVVNASAATLEFEDGTAAMASDLGLNVKVEVEGSIQSGNVLQADRVIIKLDNFIRISALVDAVDVNAQTLTLLGETINIVATTRLEDDSAANVQQFDLGDIAIGDYIEMRGSFIGTDIVASRVERDDIPVPLEVELRGIVEAENALVSITILGNVLSDNNGLTTYIDQNDATITEAAFYAAVNVGTVVEARWDNFSSILDPVDEFEIE